VSFSRMMGAFGRRGWCLLVACGLLLGVGASSSSAAVPGPPRCIGTPQAPGALAGQFPSNVIIEGVCAVNSGVAIVRGNLILRPGASLFSVFAHNDSTGSGPSRLIVYGTVRVEDGATLVIGCEPAHQPCLDDPTGTSSPRIFGNISALRPLGVIVHSGTIFGSIREAEGGGGKTCEPSGIFAELLESPVFSDYEDSTVGGRVIVSGLESCWLGLARLHVGGSVNVINNQLADPDAIEILANNIARNLNCQGNSMVWNSADLTEGVLFPRRPEPNTVNGKRHGQCVLASPETEGGEPGPGPF
jgi:hypothetical protein